MTTLLFRYAVLSASQTVDDATSGILHADAAYAAEVARTLTRRHAKPFYDTDRLLDGPYRVAVVRCEVDDPAKPDTG